MFYSQQTTKGRIVYNRKMHFFTLPRALRIVISINNKYQVGSKEFGSYYTWESLALVAVRNVSILFRKELEPMLELERQKEFLRSCCFFVYFIKQGMGYGEKVAEKLPIVKTVWAIGAFLINLLVKNVENKLPNYFYSKKYSTIFMYTWDVIPKDA